MKNDKIEIIQRLYSQMMDNIRLTSLPPFDPDAHTAEEFEIEKRRFNREWEAKSRFWELLDKLF